MSHTCHWPGCTVEVPPKMWGCRPHWFTLPKRLRDRVWAAYRPGQEITKTPSAEYVSVAQDVWTWCVEHDLRKLMDECLEPRDGRFYATDAGAEKISAWLDSIGARMRAVATDDGRYEVRALTTGDAER